MSDVNDLEIDFKVHDGYVAFSGEVVRVALLSPAVFAFIVALSGEQPTRESISTMIAPGMNSMAISFIFMALAIFFGLFHRYLAIDFMATLVEKRRKDEGMRGDWRTWASTISIVAAPFFLAVGAAFLLVAVFQILSGS